MSDDEPRVESWRGKDIGSSWRVRVGRGEGRGRKSKGGLGVETYMEELASVVALI